MSGSEKQNTPIREPILKLGQMITNRLFYKVKPEDPEYWGLAAIISDEEAEVALKMKRRVPRTLKELVKLTGKSEKELQPLLDHMSEVGVIEYNWENPQHEKQYVLPMFFPGSAEFTNMNIELLNEHPEMGRFFERMSYLPLEKVTPMVPPGGAGIGMHVIPVEKAIETENKSIDIEHISHWLKKYDGKYAASPCSCRLSRTTLDEGCGDDPMDWCIAVGDMADYVVETKKGGRYITYDEAMDILKRAEDNGFVHQITNIDG
ncbi:MAG: pyridine nucleotide-disulfide oxidoreductase, partial [Clostridiales bacterium]|nr:pyridine nucleotide-disulfide oxidoreductase [Clostridiales bacterium]